MLLEPMQKTVSMTIFPFLLLALFLSGCSRSSGVASAEAHGGGPSVAVLFLGTGEQTAGEEGAHCWSLEKLPVCEENRGMPYSCVQKKDIFPPKKCLTFMKEWLI